MGRYYNPEPLVIDGLILCLHSANKNSSSKVLYIDPDDNSTRVYGVVGTNASKWSGGVLAPNGKIYGTPNASASVLTLGQGWFDIDDEILLNRHLNKL
jgi:hypothetical protein